MEPIFRIKLTNILRFLLVFFTIYLAIKILSNDYEVDQNVFKKQSSIPIPDYNYSRTFRIDHIKKQFLKDNQPFRILSGELHYFRIPSIYWNDRIRKIKEAGLNTIQTYVPWNYHNYKQDKYSFSGEYDLVGFIKNVHQNNMLLLLRIGPYICAEWDMGGLPAWLFTINPLMKLRSSDQEYMSEVRKWFSLLLPMIKPYLYSNGGPIIMIQLENEYGTVGCDGQYLDELYEYTRLFISTKTILYTTDRSKLEELSCGSSHKFFPTIDFGASENPIEAFNVLRTYRSDVPLMNSEFYTGWLTYWGCKLGRLDFEIFNTAVIRLINNPEININFYVMHGGTNFGFWNGAGDILSPFITSYDYDAPITETGYLTKKYYAIQNAIYKFYKMKAPAPKLQENPFEIYRFIKVSKQNGLLKEILVSDTQYYRFPKTMEQLNMYGGYIIYQTNTANIKSMKAMSLKFQKISDYAYIFTGEKNNNIIKYVGEVNRRQISPIIDVILKDTLIILVENTGHISYGSNMQSDVKGLLGNVTVKNIVLENWSHVSLDTDRILSKRLLKYPRIISPSQGSLYEGDFFIDPFKYYDSHLHLSPFNKGFVIINGHNLGRFSSSGPQFSLYVPKSFLSHKNKIQIFELGTSMCQVCFVLLDSVQVMNNDKAANCN